jgi:uncharacterized protein (TIGR02453 family)
VKPKVTSSGPSATAEKGFRGWPPGAVEFLRGIELENTKAYWTDHKETYQAEVFGPMSALLAQLEPEFGEGRIFRPYRDTRFSTDKSPYKTNIAAHNATGYISLSPDALGVGTGLYMPSSEQLAQLRAAIADDVTGAELVGIVATLQKKDIEVSAHDVVKSAPRGYPRDHPRIELLRNKGITAWKEWPVGAWLGTAEPKRRIISFLRASAPLRRWLDSNVTSADR